MLKAQESTKQRIQKSLEIELERLKKRLGLGYEVYVRWLPGTMKYRNGKKLLEEVSGNTIFIYVQNQDEAEQLLAHGFAEWILNQHTKPYRQLINSLITLFEEQQYERKERLIEVITKILTVN